MSDDEEHYEPKAHKKLLQAIGSLGKVQHIQKSTRDERQSLQDEFQLVKGISSAETDHAPRAVGLNDLVDILRTSTKHSQTGKKLKNIHGSKRCYRSRWRNQLRIELNGPLATRELPRNSVVGMLWWLNRDLRRRR